MSSGTCPYCGRPTATDICPAHGFVGKVQPEKSESIPKGLIAIWSGTVATIPAKWALCDGTNGTPDLREKFIMGGGTTAPGTTGGSNAHTHSTPSVNVSASGSASGTISDGAAMSHSRSTNIAISTHPSHTHLVGGTTGAASDDTHTFKEGTGTDHTYTQAGHTHSSSYYTGYDTGGADFSHSITQCAYSDHGTHSHSFSSGSASVTGTTSAGTSGGAVGVAYYTLAFIMKVGG